MLDMLSSMFDINQMLSYGIDVTVYFFLGVIGLVLFVLRLGISILFGDVDSDFDVDVHADGDMDIATHDGGFSILSVLSILAFFTGLGWTGVLCRVDLGLSHVPSALIAAVVGFAFMFFAAGLMFFVRKLNRTITYNPADAVGKTARVYLSIPKRGQGTGQVTVTVSGRRMTMNAVSTGDAIAAFTEVIVKNAEDDETLVVEPKFAAPASEPAAAKPATDASSR
ncbi:MAG: hypothetical protein IT445_01315 [Phycisphaeraceae bacterium]|nr:hypothetical protein [Phycisphaeraceae bacterium]